MFCENGGLKEVCGVGGRGLRGVCSLFVLCEVCGRGVLADERPHVRLSVAGVFVAWGLSPAEVERVCSEVHVVAAPDFGPSFSPLLHLSPVPVNLGQGLQRCMFGRGGWWGLQALRVCACPHVCGRLMREEGNTKVSAEVLAGEVLPVGCRHTQSVSGAVSHAPAGAVWCPLSPASPIACLLLSVADACEEEGMAGVKARILKRPLYSDFV